MTTLAPDKNRWAYEPDPNKPGTFYCEFIPGDGVTACTRFDGFTSVVEARLFSLEFSGQMLKASKMPDMEAVVKNLAELLGGLNKKHDELAATVKKLAAKLGN